MECTHGGLVMWDTLTNTFREPTGTDPSGTPFTATTTTCRFPEFLAAMDEFWLLGIYGFCLVLFVFVAISLWKLR